MKFAFLVHPITEETRLLSEFDSSGEACRSWGHDLRNYCLRMHRGVVEAHRRASRAGRDRVRVIDEIRGLVSSQGVEARGRLYEIPMDALEILADPNTAMGFVEEAVDQATCWGARIAGLGSMTGIIGGQGSYLSEQAHIPVTTGDSLEVYAALENLYHACREVDIDLSKQTVAVVGVPNGIASAVAKILAGKCRSLKLVTSNASNRVKRLASQLDAELFTDVEQALRQSSVVVAATSSGDCIDQSMFRSGSVVVDVAVPTDVRGDKCLREDVLILSGGLTQIPKTTAVDSKYLWFHHGMVPSCLAETMTLALEERAECFSLGRNLEEEAIREIGQLARWHGFDFTRLFSFGLPLDESSMVRYRKAVSRLSMRAIRPNRSESTMIEADLSQKDPLMAQSCESRRALSDAEESSSPPRIGQLASRAEKLHARHLDPLLIAMGERSQSTKTFVRGEGMWLWDEDGEQYLDFFAGSGLLQLGHNPPAVTAAIQAALRDAAPGFTTGAVNPLASALAEQLVMIAPEDLEMVSFTNSGCEAVEAALKLAILSTGRSGLLHVEGSCHGRSLGTLMVSGDRNCRARLGIEAPHCRSVICEDIEQLEREIASHDYAAFIVEPILLEEAVRTVSGDYLRAAEAICRKHGTLLIVDESQTGLGRTGALFAVESHSVRPDVLTLSESLGGGLMPIGAVLTRRTLWTKAYGTIHTNLLNESALAGGSLACAAGLATIRATLQEGLAGAAQERGKQLKQGLAQIRDRCELVHEVHGEGLLLGLEFEPMPETLCTHWKELEEARLSPYLMPELDSMLQGVPALFAMQALLDSHRIFTQISKANPKLLRIQPPLSVSAQEISRFLTSLETCCHEYEFVTRMSGESIAKAGLGKHRANRRAGSEASPDKKPLSHPTPHAPI